MPVELVIVPCLTDNFAYLLHDPTHGQTALIDAPEAAPILEALRAHGWGLDMIWLTHHHDDHIQATAAVVRATGAQVLGARADAHRLPPLDQALSPGDQIAFGGEMVQILDVPGHTIGHIAFYLANAALAFTGDSLMAAGCGRLFEGTPAQMWASLARLAALPPHTQLCSGHDYLDSNLRFAQTIEPQNPAIAARIAAVAALRAKNAWPMPWTLAEEQATNPFLRAQNTEIKQTLGLEFSTDIEAFAELRRLKDRF